MALSPHGVSRISKEAQFQRNVDMWEDAIDRVLKYHEELGDVAIPKYRMIRMEGVVEKLRERYINAGWKDLNEVNGQLVLRAPELEEE
jgi:hypothetical protein